MFARTKKEIKSLETSVKELSEKYWDMQQDYLRLLDHLGIDEVRILEHKELRVKGKKENGNG